VGHRGRGYLETADATQPRMRDKKLKNSVAYV
jgi:hypothetical protein